MRLTRGLVHVALGAALVGVAACGSSNPGVQASIGPAGGSLSLASPAVTFDVPPGALTTETTVSLYASADSRSVLVTLEPMQLALAKPGLLAVSIDGARHISSITEVTHRGEQPMGVDMRIEDSSGASARLRLDHLTQVRLATGDGSDAGAPGACRERDDDDHDGEHHDGDHRDRDHDDGGMADGGYHDGENHDGGMADGGYHDGEHHDGGVADGGYRDGEHRDGGVADGGYPDGEHHDGGAEDGGHHDGEHHDGGRDDDRPDGGALASMECPYGFECDDGVCVLHGGNHEHDGEHRDGGHDDDHHDRGHD